MNLEEYKKLAEGIPLHYLMIFPGGDETKIQIIDNEFCWEIKDYKLVGSIETWDFEEGLRVAKGLAERMNIEYIPFKSDYCDYSEKKQLFKKPIIDDIIEELI